MLKAEEILKLIEAGYTKEEINKMTEAEPSQETEPKSSEEVQDVPDQEQPVKKNSESVSEEKEGEIKLLKDKLDSLEQRFFAKSREEAVIPSTPTEDLSLPTIFKSLQEE